MESIQFLQVTPEQLQNAIIEGVKLQLKDLKEHFEPKTPEEFLTRNEVSELFKVDVSTVHNWTKKGILKACQIGGRVYYKRSQIESEIIELKK